jgi:hypothetical protein
MKPSEWWKAHSSVSFITAKGLDHRLEYSGLIIFDEDENDDELEGYDDHQRRTILRLREIGIL